MYSGLTIFSKHSGALMGAHQKIDKVAHKDLLSILPDSSVDIFPSIKKVLKFEGVNGPDGVKKKSPGKDEPWHYLDPFDDSDNQLSQILAEHYTALVKALKERDDIKSAFEASWLAHAIVDGLTPAHHYPYEEELVKLRGGEGIETRTTFKKKLIMPGQTKKETLLNNWKMWGAGGLFTTHALFEMGVATLIKPLTFSEIKYTQRDLDTAREIGVLELFRRSSREVGVMDMYGRFYKKGWTQKLAWQVRHKLGPIIIQTVTLAWYLAAYDAGLVDEA